ncbi:MAG: hypothetical protein ACXWKP_08405 [Bradyrhizobium sp.]
MKAPAAAFESARKPNSDIEDASPEEDSGCMRAPVDKFGMSHHFVVMQTLISTAAWQNTYN